MQSYWTSILHVNNNSFMGRLIIGNFEKQVPGPNCSNAGLEESLSSGLISIRVANFITQWIDNSVFIQRIVFCTF